MVIYFLFFCLFIFSQNGFSNLSEHYSSGEKLAEIAFNDLCSRLEQDFPMHSVPAQSDLHLYNTEMVAEQYREIWKPLNAASVVNQVRMVCFHFIIAFVLLNDNIF